MMLYNAIYHDTIIAAIPLPKSYNQDSIPLHPIMTAFGVQ